MALADDLAGLTPSNQRGPHCTTGRILAEMPDDDRDAILNALARGVPATNVSDILRANGIAVAAQSLIRHTKGRCQRPKSSDD